MEGEETKNEEKETSQPFGKSASHESFFGFLVLLVIVVFLVLLASYGGWLLYHGVRESLPDSSRASIETLPSAASAPEKQDEPKPMEDKKNDEKLPIASSPVVVNKKVSIKVLNGGSVKGVAGEAANILTAAGFTAVSAGNAKGDYTGATVYFMNGATQADADAVKTALSKKYPSVLVKSPIPGNDDTAVSALTVIVGK